MLWERSRGGWLQRWEAVLLGSREPRWVRREDTCSYLLSRSLYLRVVLLVCRLGLPLLRAGFAGTESLSSSVQRQGVKACSQVPFCYISLQSCSPFPKFLLAWRRAKPLLAHLLLAVTSGRLRVFWPQHFPFGICFSSDYFSLPLLIKQNSDTLKMQRKKGLL